MTNNHRKLLSAIDELTQIIHNDLNLISGVQQITQDFLQIKDNLNSKKLNIYIFGLALDSVKAFHQLLTSDQALEKTCYFQLRELQKTISKDEEPIPPAFLILQDTAQGEIRYALMPEQMLEVGRKPGCHILIPNHYTSVSGNHLEIRLTHPEDCLSTPYWQVQNSSKCRNGTYMNGQPLINRWTLKTGDRLVLGSEMPNSKSPELIFEYLSHSDPQTSDSYQNLVFQELIDSDILFLVIDSDRKFSEEETKFIKQAVSLSGQDIFLVVLSCDKAKNIRVYQYPDAPVEIDRLCLQLGSINEKQIEMHKSHKVSTRILRKIQQIEQALLNQQNYLNQEIKEKEAQSVSEPRKGSASDISFLLRFLKEQKESFIKSVEISLNQAKQDLLDDSLADSIPQRIYNLVNELETHVVKQAGKKYLELKPNGVEINVNDYIVMFCEQELLDWADKEWRKICKDYSNGGLGGLVKSFNAMLKAGSTRKNIGLKFKVKNKLEFEGIFQTSLRKISCRIDYHEDPALVYFIKKIRSSVFQVMGILFLLSFLGLSRGSFIRSINKQIVSSPFLLVLAVGTIAWLIYKLYRTYKDDKLTQARKASEKIRKELQDYYQKVVKNRFVERIVSELDNNFKQEGIRLDEEVKVLLEVLQTESIQTKESRATTQKRLKDCQDDVKRLDRILREIQRIKEKLNKK